VLTQQLLAAAFQLALRLGQLGLSRLQLFELGILRSQIHHQRLHMLGSLLQLLFPR
jgi:hypothetical protein